MQHQGGAKVSPVVEVWGYDPDVLAEIAATADLMIAAAATPGRLSQGAIDRTLEVRSHQS